MTERYVDGTDGDDSYDGLAKTWDGAHGPKRTLNAAEASPVAPGDLVHVRSGLYTDTVAVSVSGSAGQEIEFRGDYAGVVWPGGGPVVISTSSNGTTAGSDAISTGGALVSFRKYSGFAFIGCWNGFYGAWLDTVFEKCFFGSTGTASAIKGITLAMDSRRVTIRRCVFSANAYGAVGISMSGSNTSHEHVIENCLFENGRNGVGIFSNGAGTVLIRNCLFRYGNYAVQTLGVNLSYPVLVKDCRICGQYRALSAGALGQILENNNNFSGNATNLYNVAAGTSSTYLDYEDTRWFFEAIYGGRLVTPYDISQYALYRWTGLDNPAASDLRESATMPALRSPGPLEYDGTLKITSGVSGGGGAVRVSPRRGGLG